jgi:hypothetical protein
LAILEFVPLLGAGKVVELCPYVPLEAGVSSKRSRELKTVAYLMRSCRTLFHMVSEELFGGVEFRFTEERAWTELSKSLRNADSSMKYMRHITIHVPFDGFCYDNFERFEEIFATYVSAPGENFEDFYVEYMQRDFYCLDSCRTPSWHPTNGCDPNNACPPRNEDQWKMNVWYSALFVCSKLADVGHLKSLRLVIPLDYQIEQRPPSCECAGPQTCDSRAHFWKVLDKLAIRLPRLQISLVELDGGSAIIPSHLLKRELPELVNPLPACGISGENRHDEVVEEAMKRGWALEYGRVNGEGDYDVEVGVPAGPARMVDVPPEQEEYQ